MAAALPAIAIGSTLAAGAITAFGKYQEGQAQSEMYKYQAGVAGINSLIAKQNADYAKHIGELQAQRKGMETKFVVGKTLATQSSSNIDVNKGSSRWVREDMRQIGAHDQAVIRDDAVRRAYGYEVEAYNQTAKGEMATMAASNARTAGTISAAGTLLGTASSVSGRWMQASRTYGWDEPRVSSPMSINASDYQW